MAATLKADLRKSMATANKTAEFAARQCAWWFTHRHILGEVNGVDGYEYCRKMFLENRKLLKVCRKNIAKNASRYLSEYAGGCC